MGGKALFVRYEYLREFVETLAREDGKPAEISEAEIEAVLQADHFYTKNKVYSNEEVRAYLTLFYSDSIAAQLKNVTQEKFEKLPQGYPDDISFYARKFGMNEDYQIWKGQHASGKDVVEATLDLPPHEKLWHLNINGDEQDKVHQTNADEMALTWRFFGTAWENTILVGPSAPVLAGGSYFAASQEGVDSAMAELTAKAGPKDLLVVYWTGHGDLKGDDPQLIFPQGQHYSVKRLAQQLKGLPVMGVVFVADPCFSGPVPQILEETLVGSKYLEAQAPISDTKTTQCGRFIPYWREAANRLIDLDGRPDILSLREPFLYALQHYNEENLLGLRGSYRRSAIPLHDATDVTAAIDAPGRKLLMLSDPGCGACKQLAQEFDNFQVTLGSTIPIYKVYNSWTTDEALAAKVGQQLNDKSISSQSLPILIYMEGNKVLQVRRKLATLEELQQEFSRHFGETFNPEITNKRLAEHLFLQDGIPTPFTLQYLNRYGEKVLTKLPLWFGILNTKNPESFVNDARKLLAMPEDFDLSYDLAPQLIALPLWAEPAARGLQLELVGHYAKRELDTLPLLLQEVAKKGPRESVVGALRGLAQTGLEYYALPKFHSLVAAPQIKAFLQALHSGDPGIRLVALESFAEWRSQSYFRVDLAKELGNPSSRTDLSKLISVLKQGDKILFKTIAQFLRSSSDEQQAVAIKALFRLRKISVEATHLFDEVMQKLPPLKTQAMFVLISEFLNLGYEEAQKVLKQASPKLDKMIKQQMVGPHEEGRAKALTLLSWSPRPPSWEEMVAWFEGGKIPVASLTLLLSKLPVGSYERYKNLLDPLLEHEDEMVVTRVMTSLRGPLSEPLRTRLQELLIHDRIHVRKAAAKTLAYDQPSQEFLLAVAKGDADGGVRYQAFQGLKDEFVGIYILKNLRDELAVLPNPEIAAELLSHYLVLNNGEQLDDFLKKIPLDDVERVVAIVERWMLVATMEEHRAHRKIGTQKLTEKMVAYARTVWNQYKTSDRLLILQTALRSRQKLSWKTYTQMFPLTIDANTDPQLALAYYQLQLASTPPEERKDFYIAAWQSQNVTVQSWLLDAALFEKDAVLHPILRDPALVKKTPVFLDAKIYRYLRFKPSSPDTQSEETVICFTMLKRSSDHSLKADLIKNFGQGTTQEMVNHIIPLLNEETLSPAVVYFLQKMTYNHSDIHLPSGLWARLEKFLTSQNLDLVKNTLRFAVLSHEVSDEQRLKISDQFSTHPRASVRREALELTKLLLAYHSHDQETKKVLQKYAKDPIPQIRFAANQALAALALN
ncbi:MAG: hypothetical protein HYU97_09460 [Deltaproteobacteria bacterium]|nr:hypothetical protein [Deltaproteobacteria bacterium]